MGETAGVERFIKELVLDGAQLFRVGSLGNIAEAAAEGEENVPFFALALNLATLPVEVIDNLGGFFDELRHANFEHSNRVDGRLSQVVQPVLSGVTHAPSPLLLCLPSSPLTADRR